MAKLSAHGKVLYTAESRDYLRRAMEDGIVLRSWRYEGRVQSWTVQTRLFKGRPDTAVFAVKEWEARRAS